VRDVFEKPSSELLEMVDSHGGTFLFRVRPPAGIVRRYLAGKDAPKELVGRFRDAFGSVDHRTLLRRAEAVFSVDVREAFRKVQVPVLYLRATKDRIVDERSVREILAIRNDVKVVPIEAAHFVLQTRPRESAAAIEEFARGL